MSYETFIKDYKKQYESLKLESQELFVAAPEVNISDEVNDFCESLQFMDDDEREQRLNNFIRPTVEHKVEEWQSNLAHAHGSLVRLNDMVDGNPPEK